MDLAMYIIYGILTVGAVVYGVLSVRTFITSDEQSVNLLKGKNLVIPGTIAGGGVSFMLVFLPLALKSTVLFAKFMITLGALLFSLSLLTFLAVFFLHYYKFNVEKVWVKRTKLTLYITALLTIISLVVLLDGLTYGGVLSFPLPKGIPFGDNPVVHFYALFILSGALLVLAISDHEFYKKYGKHGILENVFYVAFPAGIIGARIWYVIGEWHKFNGNFMKMIDFRDGGLAIMGGAMFGIIAGVLFFLKYRKEYDPFFAADVIIPTILIAQAIGRFGNFTNQEVYGGIINASEIGNYWFLPAFIKENMFIAGEFRQPFFLYELLLNLVGYFVIRFAIGEALKKYRKPLDLAFMYLVWYGAVRFIMEPLRDPQFRMGETNVWSEYNALILLIVGVVGIVANHVIRYVLNKKALANAEIETDVSNE